MYKITRSVLLYAAPVWAGAPRTYLDKLQRTQNKFLRVALNASRDARIVDLYKMAEIESIDEIMARMLSGTFYYNHDNPLIREIGNYEILGWKISFCNHT